MIRNPLFYLFIYFHFIIFHRNFDSLFELDDEDRARRLVQHWKDLGLKRIQLINSSVLVASPGPSPNIIIDMSNVKCYLPTGGDCHAELNGSEEFAFAAYSAAGSLEVRSIIVLSHLC